MGISDFYGLLKRLQENGTYTNAIAECTKFVIQDSAEKPTDAIVDLSGLLHKATYASNAMRAKEIDSLAGVLFTQSEIEGLRKIIVTDIDKQIGPFTRVTTVHIVIDGVASTHKTRTCNIDSDAYPLNSLANVDQAVRDYAGVRNDQAFTRRILDFLLERDWLDVSDTFMRFAKTSGSFHMVSMLIEWFDNPETYSERVEAGYTDKVQKKLAKAITKCIRPPSKKIVKCLKKYIGTTRRNWVFHQAPGEADHLMAELAASLGWKTVLVTHDSDFGLISACDVTWRTRGKAKTWSSREFWLNCMAIILPNYKALKKLGDVAVLDEHLDAFMERTGHSDVPRDKYMHCVLMIAANVLYAATDYHTGRSGAGKVATATCLCDGVFVPDFLTDTLPDAVLTMWLEHFVAIADEMAKRITRIKKEYIALSDAAATQWFADNPDEGAIPNGLDEVKYDIAIRLHFADLPDSPDEKLAEVVEMFGEEIETYLL